MLLIYRGSAAFNGENLLKCIHRSSYICLVCPLIANTHPHDSAAAPSAASKESLTRSIDSRYDLVGFAIVILLGCVWMKIKEPQDSLIDDGFCQNLRAGHAADFGYKR